MKVEIINSWNSEFFQRFLEFKNFIHQDIPTSFPEKLEDYEKYFFPSSIFATDFHWKAVIISDQGEMKAKAILCWKADSLYGSLGFIDWVQEDGPAKLLISTMEKIAKEAGLKSLKTPVDLNFFVKYRIRCPGGGTPFYGEPIYPDYYHDLFKLNGFEVIGSWDTYQIEKLRGIKDYLSKRKKLGTKKDGSHHKTKNKDLKTTIRCVRLHDWDNEIKIIYDLFNEAYSKMPEYESVNFPQFKIIYDDFKYIINPLYAYIIELRGKPVGFSINFVDPLPLLLPHKGKELSILQKAILLAKIKLNNGCYMISHVGKIPGPNGEEIKGVQIQVSNRISATVLFMRKVIVTFQNVNSPSRRSFNENLLTPYAQYVLYGKNLE